MNKITKEEFIAKIIDYFPSDKGEFFNLKCPSDIGLKSGCYTGSTCNQWECWKQAIEQGVE